MKIIFIKDIKGQGCKNDIKEVKDGYANFLINSGSAVKYSEKSLFVLNKEIKNKKDEEELLVKEANDMKKKLSKLCLEFKVKTGEKDKVFGSVSSKMISEELKSHGFEIDKKKIILEDGLNTLGVHIVKVILYKDIKGELNISLVK